MKLWQGRSSGEVDKLANDFNASISVDKRMYKEDIEGSVAHAEMLGKTGIIPSDEAAKIMEGLQSILADIESGVLPIDDTAEDIHTFIECELTARIKNLGKKLHTARSRNDQVATDFRLYCRRQIAEIKKLLYKLMSVIVTKAEKNTDAVMPGYTHLQRAQPVTFGHHLMAYYNMFKRDYGRLTDAAARMNVSPLGSAALAGTPYSIDREMTAHLLGFDDVMDNSMDGVSDRDYCLEIASALSMIAMHLSRFSEEIILWCSWEFKFIELDDAYSTGSSIMPQKKNPDIAELIRGKCGRVYGNMMTLFTVMKGLPLAYNKDMQEDKEALFDSFDTVSDCLSLFAPMLETAVVNKDNMYKAASRGFINATDCADYLTMKGVPFRTAYEITGKLVACCIKEGFVLENLPLEVYKKHSAAFERDIYAAIDMNNCLEKRTSQGGASKKAVTAQIEKAKSYLISIQLQ